MGTEVEKFEDRVKERIKNIVADLIPEEQWQAIVDKTIADFTKNELPEMVKDEMKAFCKKEIEKIFSSPEFANKWDSNKQGHVVSDAVMKMLVESAPLMFASMIQNTVAYTIMQMRNNAQNGVYGPMSF